MKASAAATGAEDRAHTRRGAAANLLTLLGQSSFMIFGSLVSHLFGQAIWGAYTTAVAWIDVLVRVSLAGTDKSLLVLIAARRGQSDEPGAIRALVTALRLTAALGVACALIMAGASWLVTSSKGSPLDKLAMRALAPVVITTSLSTLVLAATMATKTLRYNLRSRGIAEPAVMLTLTGIIGLTAPSMWTLAVVPLIAGLVSLSIAFTGLRARFDLRAVRAGLVHEPTEGAVIRYAVPLALAEILNVIVFRLPIFVLVPFAAPAERAVFNTCLLLAGSVSFLRGAFDTVLAPLAAEAWAQNDQARLAENLKRLCRLVLFAAIPFGSLFIVGGPTVLALFGPGFSSGTRALAWLAGAHIINASFGLIGWVHMVSGRTRLVLINNVLLLLVGGTLCLVLIPRFGVEGAAASTAITLVFSQIVYSVQAHLFARVHPLSPGFLRLLVVGAGLIAAELAVARLIHGLPAWGAIAVPLAGVPIYLGIAWWGIGLRRDHQRR